MERMFFLTLVPHETSPPVEVFMVQLRGFLSKLGKLLSFSMHEDGRVFKAELCSEHSGHDLVQAFCGMMVKVRVTEQEQEGEGHDCLPQMVA